MKLLACRVWRRRQFDEITASTSHPITSAAVTDIGAGAAGAVHARLPITAAAQGIKSGLRQYPTFSEPSMIETRAIAPRDSATTHDCRNFYNTFREQVRGGNRQQKWVGLAGFKHGRSSVVVVVALAHQQPPTRGGAGGPAGAAAPAGGHPELPRVQQGVIHVLP